MVSTRYHPKQSSPGKGRRASSSSSSSTDSGGTVRRWTHTPSTVMSIWLLISLPLVLRDASYLLLKPLSADGGHLHSPVWTPYLLYGIVDYTYGRPVFNARTGLTAAQTVMNLVETAAYLFYLRIVYIYGISKADSGRGYHKKRGLDALWWFLRSDKVVSGREGAIAVLVGYTASTATLSRTALYCGFSCGACFALLFTHTPPSFY